MAPSVLRCACGGADGSQTTAARVSSGRVRPRDLATPWDAAPALKAKSTTIPGIHDEAHREVFLAAACL
jgi:hypothetical protein